MIGCERCAPLCFSSVCAEEDFALRFKFRLTCTSNPTQTMLYASSRVRLLCSESVELAVVALSYPSAFTVLRLVRRLPALAVTRSTCMSLHMQLLRRRRRSQAYQTIMRSHLAAADWSDTETFAEKVITSNAASTQRVLALF